MNTCNMLQIRLIEVILDMAILDILELKSYRIELKSYRIKIKNNSQFSGNEHLSF